MPCSDAWNTKSHPFFHFHYCPILKTCFYLETSSFGSVMEPPFKRRWATRLDGVAATPKYKEGA